MGKKSLHLLVAFLVVLLIPQLAGHATNQLAPTLSAVDPDKAFAWISVHHVFQLLLTVVLMKICIRQPLSEWGFNLRQKEDSLRIFWKFCLIYLIPVFFVNVMPYLSTARVPAFSYPLTAGNMSGVLGFQFLLSGTGEEPLFRGFVMVWLAQSWMEKYQVAGVSISSAGLWATLLFVLAHIDISLYPFAIGQVSFSQLQWSLFLGLYYAVVFDKTRSLLGPVLSHNYANGIIFVILYLLSAFKG